MGILAWIVLGIIAGAIAKAIYPGRQGGGFLSTMILGIVGAFVGGTLYSFFTGAPNITALTFASSGFIPSLFVAVIGALVAIFLWSLFTRSNAV
jgi:uncharacterized membrane protein YeaQ/YmgE (transglycosylase-associated protein family)